MHLIQSVVIAIAIATPVAVIYFRRATAIASITAFILALAVCDESTRCVSMLALLVVVFALSVDVAERDETPPQGRQATLDGDGRTIAETTNEREID